MAAYKTKFDFCNYLCIGFYYTYNRTAAGCSIVWHNKNEWSCPTPLYRLGTGTVRVQNNGGFRRVANYLLECIALASLVKLITVSQHWRMLAT